MSPSKQEKKFKKEYSQELIKIALGDLGTAKVLLANISDQNIRIENIFFLAQQSIEKSLKAVLVANEIPVPMVHELGILVGKLPASSNPHFGYELANLSEFASTRRYEEGALTLTSEEAQDVVQQTENIYQWANSLVQKLN